MRTEVGLVRLLKDAGVEDRTARWHAWLVDHTADYPEGSDALAGVLLRWKRRAEVDAYHRGFVDAVAHIARMTKGTSVSEVELPTKEDFDATFAAAESPPWHQPGK